MVIKLPRIQLLDSLLLTSQSFFGRRRSIEYASRQHILHDKYVTNRGKGCRQCHFERKEREMYVRIMQSNL